MREGLVGDFGHTPSQAKSGEISEERNTLVSDRRGVGAREVEEAEEGEARERLVGERRVVGEIERSEMGEERDRGVGDEAVGGEI